MNNPWSKFAYKKPIIVKPIIVKPIRVNVKCAIKHHLNENIDCVSIDENYIKLSNGEKQGIEPWDEWRYI